MSKQRWYSIDVAAAAVGVKPRQIERWINLGVISPLITAGTVYVTVEAVTAAPGLARRHGYRKLARSLTNRGT